MRDRHTALQLCKTCWPQLVATAGHNCTVSSLRVRVNERQTHCTATICKTCWPQLVATAGHNCTVSSLMRVRVNERQTHCTATRCKTCWPQLVATAGHNCTVSSLMRVRVNHCTATRSSNTGDEDKPLLGTVTAGYCLPRLVAAGYSWQPRARFPPAGYVVQMAKLTAA
jgi:hypothetical protein